MSTPKYTVTVYNDSRVMDGQELVHTWLELSDGINPPKVYSFGPATDDIINSIYGSGHFDEPSSSHVSQARKNVCDSITIELTDVNIFDTMVRKGNSLIANSKNGNLNYAICGGFSGDSIIQNCTTVTRSILQAGGINILDGCISPQAAKGRIDLANKYGEKYCDNFVTQVTSNVHSWLDWTNSEATLPSLDLFSNPELYFQPDKDGNPTATPILAYQYADDQLKNLTGKSIAETTLDICNAYGNGKLDQLILEQNVNDMMRENAKDFFTSLSKNLSEAEMQKINSNQALADVLLLGIGTLFGKAKETMNSFCDILSENSNIISVAPEAMQLPGGSAGFVSFLQWFKTVGNDAKTYGYPDPIAIDLDGDGIETVSKENSSAYFDLDKNGFAEKTGWIKGDDGILVRDVNGDGVINDGSELFGDQTALAGGGVASTGYQALSDLDSNKDGKITAEDEAFGELKVWQDRSSLIKASTRHRKNQDQSTFYELRPTGGISQVV